jgi:hypothetical protein
MTVHGTHWALAGEWSVSEDAAALQAAGGSLAYRFQARDVNVVLAPPPSGAPCVSACASMVSRPEMPTASTSTSRVRVRSASRVCTSSFAGEQLSLSAASRSRSSTRPCARTDFTFG